jgi:hypothetical protein
MEMEDRTMQLNLSETPATSSLRMPLLNLRWGGIFAGLAVGIACNLLLLLVGVSIGLSAFDVTKPPSGQTASIAAVAWNIACMVIAAFVGGYVAARAAGMHRSSDGILHGAVSWGVTMLASMLLATSATSSLFGTLFQTGVTAGVAGAQSGAGSSIASTMSGGAGSEVMSRIQQGDRQAAVDSLRTRLGISADQAGRVVDQALIASGHPEAASQQGRDDAEQAMKTAGIVTSSLSASVILSLLAAIGGGLLGARGTRRSMGASYTERRHTTYEDVPGTRM